MILHEAWVTMFTEPSVCGYETMGISNDCWLFVLARILDQYLCNTHCVCICKYVVRKDYQSLLAVGCSNTKFGKTYLFTSLSICGVSLKYVSQVWKGSQCWPIAWSNVSTTLRVCAYMVVWIAAHTNLGSTCLRYWEYLDMDVWNMPQCLLFLCFCLLFLCFITSSVSIHVYYYGLSINVDWL